MTDRPGREARAVFLCPRFDASYVFARAYMRVG